MLIKNMNKLLTNLERVTMIRSMTFGLRSLLLTLAAAMMCAGTSAASAIDVGDVRFATRAAAGASQLELLGAGVLRYRGVIRAYAAALYAAPDLAPERVLDDVPKRLEIEYFWSLDAEDFASAANELLERTQSPAQLAALRERLDYLNARYEDIEPGDRYALTYTPGVGTELSKNGRPLGVVAGSDFAAAYFAMWLGERPIDVGLRDALRTRISERAQN
jgi:hypothetical protein